jgi:hypothetical protein
VPALDDERFEAYLKEFRPIVPDPLPAIDRKQEYWRSSAPRLWAVGLATIVILGVITFRTVNSRVAKKLSNPPSIEVALPRQPLTMRDANALLATAPSYKAAVDSMAFRNQALKIPQDKQSALAVLAKEKIRL